ncbi:YraN family protein [Candidatus Dependentiae bacterium]|nr:YraN family protein [Candidatus Dependentiae bacterium]
MCILIMKNKQLGNSGEKAIQKFLEKNKFKIIASNYKSKWGEIDIIAQKKDLISFIEVKTRKTAYFPISQVVNYTKQQKIIKTAKMYIQRHNIYNKICRFDVATVLLSGNSFDIEYIENAFQE